MSIKSLEEFKTDIDILSLDIENLDNVSKVQIFQHMEETLNILKLGSSLEFGNSAKNIKLETTEKVDNCTQTDIQEEMLLKEETVELKPDPLIDEDYVKELYNGIIPTCGECQAQFQSIGALDKHSKSHINTNEKLEVKEEPVISNFSRTKDLAKSKIFHANKFQCDTCGKRFFERGNFDKHQMNEENCMKYMNSLANDEVIIDDEGEGMSERNLNDSSTSRFCDICNISVNSKNFSRHVATTVHKELAIQKNLGLLPSNKGSIVCRTCKLSFDSRSRFSHHLKQKCNKNEAIPTTYVADVQIEHLNKEDKIKHVTLTSTDNGVKRFSKHLGFHPSNTNDNDKRGLKRSFDDSVMGYKKESSLKVLKKSSSEVFICNKCNLTYNNRKSLETHKVTHTDKYKCQTCQYQFACRRDLESHSKNPDNCKKLMKKSIVESKTPVEQPKFNCMECNMVLTSNRSFQLHVKTHEVKFNSEPAEDQEELEDLFQCEQCYKYFASEITFNNHKQSHTETDALDSLLSKEQTLESDDAKDCSLKFSSTIPDLILDTTR